MMNESVYNAVIDALIDEFGKDTVLSNVFNYTLTQENLKKIFSILNMHLFGNQLKFFPVVLWPMSKLVDKLNYHAKMSGDENKEIHHTRCFGVYTSICTDVFGKHEELIDLKIRDSYLIINSSEMKNLIFIFAVAVICHEMIHAYDQQMSNEIHDIELEWEKDHSKIKPNFHSTSIFKSKMQEANDNGINVVSELSSDSSHRYDNSKARFVLKQVIGETENPEIEVLSSDNDLFMHNKKTGYGFFAHFD